MSQRRRATEAQYLIVADDFIESFRRYDEFKFLLERSIGVASTERRRCSLEGLASERLRDRSRRLV